MCRKAVNQWINQSIKAHQAHASYNAYLEKKNLKEPKAKHNKAEEEAAAAARKEAEKNLKEGKKLQSLEDSLMKTKTGQHTKEKLIDSLLTKVDNTLKKAVGTGDVTDIAVAQTLLDVRRKQTAKFANEMQKRVDKRKLTMLDHFIKSPKTDWLNS